jgi:hypothetical protein
MIDRSVLGRRCPQRQSPFAQADVEAFLARLLPFVGQTRTEQTDGSNQRSVIVARNRARPMP